MKCLLLALALACSVQAVVLPQTPRALDVLKLAGPWHAVAVAAQDAQEAVEPAVERQLLRMYVKELRPTPELNLEIILGVRDNGKCIEEKIIAKKTEIPTKFKFNYLAEQELILLDTNHEDFLFLCMEGTAMPPQKLACQYLARTLEAQPEIMDKFRADLKMLPTPMQVFRDLTQEEEPCRL
ncbi:glycodelin [Ochotona curzoniae]|uniref:glycodelin n=1 Tax=Ochotona curzoniae TaxID=130825 RepID=UPI001B35331F|nr:glycodelin [Ochotona curzoniae]